MKKLYPLGLPIPIVNLDADLARIKAQTAAIEAAPKEKRRQLCRAFRERLGWTDGFRGSADSDR